MSNHSHEATVTGLSGGVDSSVAAWLLAETGARLIGATHYTQESSPCCNDETIARARVVCRNLGIPYRLLNLRGTFQKLVVDQFVATYLDARTPNPCITCNEQLRFDAFYHDAHSLLLEEGLLRARDPLYIATGHYARIEKVEGRTFIRKGADPQKDQSYMLYRIPRDVLPFVKFPLGDYLKSEVVAIAERENLPTKSIKESQDICFADGNYIGFLRRCLGEEKVDQPGKITDTSGRPIGTHRGYLHYTIGQRQGLGLADGPWYVAAINAAENLVVVARKENLGDTAFSISRVLWDIPEDPPLRCKVKIRYNSREVPCLVSGNPASGQLHVELEEKAGVTPGQSAVFYRDDLVIGGGIIER